MPLLYFWRGDNYRRDLDYGAGYHLNQNSPSLHQIESGDSLWAFTRTPDKRYVLAAELVIRAKTLNPPSFRYGRYRVWGDLRHSRYFSVADQPNLESLFCVLSIKPKGSPLGRSFQGQAAVRQILLEDHQMLAEAARHLAPEPRARILPEERLEALIYLGDTVGIQELIRAEPVGIIRERAEYLYTIAPKRNRGLTRDLRLSYRGQCQICQWSPKTTYKKDICEGHHLRWLSRGGDDSLENIALLCPNHHRTVHACDAAFDYADLSFDFGFRRERLTLNNHVPVIN